MNIRNTITAAIVLSTGLTLVAGNASYAQSFRDLLRGSGNYEANFSQHQQATMTNLINKETSIRTDITAALRAGTIDRSSGNDILRELDSVAALRGSYNPSRFSFSEAQTLASRLSAIEARATTLISAGSTMNPAPIVGNGSMTMTSAVDIQNRIASLRLKISQKLSAGIISANQADRLSNELGDIENDLSDMRSSGLRNSERVRLTSDLDALDSRMDRVASRGGFGGSSTVANLRMKSNTLKDRIENAVTSGNLRGYQARSLRMEMNDISRQLERLPYRSSMANSGELFSLNQKLTALDQRVTTELRMAGRRSNWH